MTNRPICPKGQRKKDSPCIFCQDGSYCAHQYYCSATRRYENTGWRECRRELPFAKGGGICEANGGGVPSHGGELEERTLSQAQPDSPPCEGGPAEDKVKEVEKVGAKKANRRKSRKG